MVTFFLFKFIYNLQATLAHAMIGMGEIGR